jgi:hypothetical protein
VSCDIPGIENGQEIYLVLLEKFYIHLNKAEMAFIILSFLNKILNYKGWVLSLFAKDKIHFFFIDLLLQSSKQWRNT